MLNSLLSVSIESTISTVFIILGVVVAASLILYFIWEAILIYSKKNNKNENKTNVNQNVSNQNVEDFHFEEEVKQEPKLLQEGNIVDVDEVKATEEQAQVEAVETEEERINRERREYLERRRQELIRRLQEDEAEETEQETEETAEAEEEVEDEDVDDNDEVEEVEEQEDEADEEVEEDEVPEDNHEEEIARLEAEKEELLREKERYEQMCKELEEAKQKLLETVQPEIVQVPVSSLDDLKARLADAEEKLRANEKDFKQCKKDFIPLNKVWKTHENDEKKLRRKEALVAKQKVVLYGVNNYADIDEEKAKKLAEDLDLLDGLKLSVQHCEEVMAKNAERYPLLKRMYEVLKRQNTELKDEIKSLRAEIEEREAEENAEGENE